MSDPEQPTSPPDKTEPTGYELLEAAIAADDAVLRDGTVGLDEWSEERNRVLREIMARR